MAGYVWRGCLQRIGKFKIELYVVFKAIRRSWILNYRTFLKVEDDGGGGGGNGGGAEQQEECLFAINPTGICIYKNGSKISSYFWPRINRVHYKANRLMLNVVDKTVSFLAIKIKLKWFF